MIFRLRNLHGIFVSLHSIEDMLYCPPDIIHRNGVDLMFGIWIKLSEVYIDRRNTIPFIQSDMFVLWIGSKTTRQIGSKESDGRRIHRGRQVHNACIIGNSEVRCFEDIC